MATDTLTRTREDVQGNPVIGKVRMVVTEGFDDVYAGYETAAWHDTARIPAGVYEGDLVLGRNVHMGPRKPMAIVRIDAVQTAKYTPALFGGVAYGTQPQGENHRDVGSTVTRVFRLFGAALAGLRVGRQPERWADRGVIWQVEWDDDAADRWEVVQTTYRSPIRGLDSGARCQYCDEPVRQSTQEERVKAVAETRRTVDYVHTFDGAEASCKAIRDELPGYAGGAWPRKTDWVDVEAVKTALDLREVKEVTA